MGKDHSSPIAVSRGRVLRRALLLAALLSLALAASAQAEPDTTINSGPAATTADSTPSFAFSSDDPEASFECRVDADEFAACSGPGATHTTAALGDGPHSFEVRAVDAAQNPDPTPASRSFTVDTAGPETTITKRPGDRIESKSRKIRVEVSFASEPGATYRCRLDRAKYEPCESPYGVKVKAKGGNGVVHELSVRATDEAGNVGDPVTVDFRVLRTPRLRAPVARRAVVTALKRHDFARRVVKSARIDCHRRSRSAFGCSFSARFPGYKMKGRGKVTLATRLSYRFRVEAQGVSFTLTDENEGSRLAP